MVQFFFENRLKRELAHSPQKKILSWPMGPKTVFYGMISYEILKF